MPTAQPTNQQVAAFAAGIRRKAGVGPDCNLFTARRIVNLKAFVADHGFDCWTTTDERIAIEIPWTRLNPDGTYDEGTTVEIAHPTLSDVRYVLGY